MHPHSTYDREGKMSLDERDPERDHPAGTVIGPDSSRRSRTPWGFWRTSRRRDSAHRPIGEQPGAGFYPGLDLLRGFAAVSVVVYHIIEIFHWRDFPSSNPFFTWFRIGGFGVDLFFVISGFVITLSAFKLLDRYPGDYAGIYCTRRLARIVPLHYATCLLSVALLTPGLMIQPGFWVHAVTHLSFLHNWLPQTNGSINGPNWSLGVEMQFYLVILLLLPRLRHARPSWVLAACIATSWSWRSVAFALFHGRIRAGVNLTWLGTSQVFGMMDEFGFGIALAIILHQGGTRIAGRLHATRWLWPLAAALVATVTMHIYWRDAAYWGNWRMVVFWRTMLGGTSILVIVSAVAVNDRWFLVLTAPLRYLGTISYGIYLWHMLVMTAIRPLFANDPPRACLWTLCLTLLLASLSWHFFEKPMMERFGRIGEGRSASRLATQLAPDRRGRLPIALSGREG
jgi:peptidoglycan/LPS O-acetylase OafA/YrhL